MPQIRRYAQGCAYASFCTVLSARFSARFGAIGIDWATGGILQQVKSSHSMRLGAVRGKPDGPKRLPISLGFKCANCRSEFDSRHAMNIHRRHISLVGTPCHGADPSNSKSMSWTARGDHSAGILRQHDTLGVLPKPAFFVCCPNRYFRICSLNLWRIVITVH